MSKQVLVNEGVEADLEAMKADAERIGVEVPSKASAKKLAELLRKKYKEKLEDVPKDDWVQCETCGEITDDDPEIEACPFCGDEGVDPDEEGDDSEGDDGEAESPAEPEKLDDDEDEEESEGDDGDDEDEEEGDDGDDDEDVAETVKGQKSRAEKQSDDEDDDTPAPREPKRVDVHADDGDGDEEEEKPATKSKAKGKKKTTKKKAPAKSKAKGKRRDTEKNTSRKTDGKGKGKTSKSSTTKPAKTKGDGVDKTQEQLFEESKDRILTYKRELTERGYDLGLELKRQHEEELWKVAGFKHFRAFVESVGVSHTFAYQLMKIVKDFSREQYVELGPKKLAILGKVPESQRKGLEEKAKGGASSTDLSREASKAKGDKGKGKGDDGGGDGAPPLEKSGKRGRPSKEDQRIELLTKVGGKAKTYSFVSRDGKELKEWERDAYVKIQLSDDVVQYIGLKTDRSGKKIVGISTMFARVEEK